MMAKITEDGYAAGGGHAPRDTVVGISAEELEALNQTARECNALRDYIMRMHPDTLVAFDAIK